MIVWHVLLAAGIFAIGFVLGAMWSISNANWILDESTGGPFPTNSTAVQTGDKSE